MKSISRREFIRTAAAAGAAVTAFGTGALYGAEELTVNGLPASILGRTGLKVTKISLGGALLGEPALLMKAVESGINLVHTAHGYRNNLNMQAFGNAVKADKSLREKVILAVNTTPDKIDESLKLLNTDYIDIMVPALTSAESLEDKSLPEGFEKVKEAGKARFLGWAGHSNTTELFRKGVELGWFDVTLMAYSNIKDPEFLQAAKEANEAGIGIITMKGLPKRFSEELTGEEKATITSLCGTMLNSQYAHSVCASMSNFQAIEFYLDVMKTKLGYYNPGLEERYWASQQGSYCSMCGECEGLCPEGKYIPRIVRYRMYAKDYGLKDHARECYSRLQLKATDLPADKLELCESACSRRLPLRQLLAEAHAMLG